MLQAASHAGQDTFVRFRTVIGRETRPCRLPSAKDFPLGVGFPAWACRLSHAFSTFRAIDPGERLALSPLEGVCDMRRMAPVVGAVALGGAGVAAQSTAPIPENYYAAGERVTLPAAVNGD